jgi:hypothetical protein
MTTVPPPDHPGFDEALRRLETLLHSAGVDRPVKFLDESNLIATRGLWSVRDEDDRLAREVARTRYESAVASRLGVSLNAQCIIGNFIGVSVGTPSSPDEAERLLYPDGLKLTVAEPLREATGLPPDEWFTLRSQLQHEGHTSGVDPELLK